MERLAEWSPGQQPRVVALQPELELAQYGDRFSLPRGKLLIGRAVFDFGLDRVEFGDEGDRLMREPPESCWLARTRRSAGAHAPNPVLRIRRTIWSEVLSWVCNAMDRFGAVF